MLAYATIGTADLDKAKTYYSALLEDMGAKIVMDIGRLVAYGTGNFSRSKVELTEEIGYKL